ncbi:MAG: S41 family peptidase, partial [Myxococcota bacterium]
RVLVVSDAAGGAERLEIHRVDGSAPPVVVSLDGGDSLGRVVRLELSPGQDAAALTNHRNEIVHVDLERGRARVLDRSRKARPEGIAWSRGGRWLAYSIARTRLTSVLMLADTQTWERHQVTEGSFRDVEPAFDPQGRYLYFLSMRTFNPTYGEAFFELNFNHMWTPCLVTLREDIESPFLDKPRALEDDEDEEDGKRDEQGCRDDVSSQDAAVHTALAEEDPGEGDEEVEEFDVEGIRRRVLALPVPARDYAQLGATKDRVFYIAQPVRGALSAGEPARVLRFFDLKKKRERRFSVGVDAFDLSADGKTIAMSSDDGLRVVSATGAGPEEDADDAPSRETGWLDLGRVACAVEPREEWRQMLREVWRLMRDQFWREDMSGVDWDAIWTRYSRLLERVATRSELSDVIWTMQGELGTSHAYEMGGDYRRRPPSYDVGQLGADVAWDPDWTHPQASTRGGYRITHIVRGDDWSTTDASPLTRPGLDIAEGDVLVAINGRALGEAHSVQQRLVNQAGREVELMLWREGEEEPRRRTVKTLASERALRYREWVEQRRDIAHERGGGRVGYVHIPDMGARGYAEFHRSYMAESHHDALVVDVRCNGGGHVSQLILERLARSVLGYDIPRWEDPVSYPAEGPRGPLVALTNAHAGSDGDIFSHCFKLLKLGPLMGERTWGGVIGIWPRHSLVDGTVTTQPEFSFWFVDVGFGVENYGTDPDIEVPMPPEAWAADEDVQLHQAIDKALESLQAYSPGFPDFGPAPVLAAPPLPEPPSE